MTRKEKKGREDSKLQGWVMKGRWKKRRGRGATKVKTKVGGYKKNENGGEARDGGCIR